MAMTQARIQNDEIIGKRRVSYWTLTGDSAYPAGGYAVTGAQFGLRSIEGILQIGANSTGYSVIYNTATAKLQFYSNGSEASGNISTVSVKVIVISIDD
jgi:hypothetical protein